MRSRGWVQQAAPALARPPKYHRAIRFSSGILQQEEHEFVYSLAVVSWIRIRPFGEIQIWIADPDPNSIIEDLWICISVTVSVTELLYFWQRSRSAVGSNWGLYMGTCIWIYNMPKNVKIQVLRGIRPTFKVIFMYY